MPAHLSQLAEDLLKNRKCISHPAWNFSVLETQHLFAHQALALRLWQYHPDYLRVNNLTSFHPPSARRRLLVSAYPVTLIQVQTELIEKGGALSQVRSVKHCNHVCSSHRPGLWLSALLLSLGAPSLSAPGVHHSQAAEVRDWQGLSVLESHTSCLGSPGSFSALLGWCWVPGNWHTAGPAPRTALSVLPGDCLGWNHLPAPSVPYGPGELHVLLVHSGISGKDMGRGMLAFVLPSSGSCVQLC